VRATSSNATRRPRRGAELMPSSLAGWASPTPQLPGPLDPKLTRSGEFQDGIQRKSRRRGSAPGRHDSVLAAVAGAEAPSAPSLSPSPREGGIASGAHTRGAFHPTARILSDCGPPALQVRHGSRRGAERSVGPGAAARCRSARKMTGRPGTADIPRPTVRRDGG
jgi:hypothetical protein